MPAFDTLLAEVEADYRRRTPTSAALYDRALASMPGGDTRQTVFFTPYPLFLARGEGSYVTDVDGHRYFDCSSCWSALVLGHAHPAVTEAVGEQLARGTAYNAASPHALELIELLRDRIPSLRRVRLTNTGSEATMLAVRAARAATGRRKIVKMIGAYHGAHDDWQVHDGDPQPGLIPGNDAFVREVPFNDKTAVTDLLNAEATDIAALIVEPVMGVAGSLPPLDGYLHHLRAETERHGIVLIFDEVITLRLALGGAQALYDLRPDLTTMGKIIGGGHPIGAFGGDAQLMEQFSPLRDSPLSHSGTLNANPVSAIAGIATLRQLDADTISYINRLGDRFAAAVAAIAQARDVPLHTTGLGSIRNLHFGPTPPLHAAQAAAGDMNLRLLLHRKLLTLGVLAVERGMFAFATTTTEADVDDLTAKIDGAIAWMRPAIEERRPQDG